MQLSPFLRALLVGVSFLLVLLAGLFLLDLIQVSSVLRAGGWLERPEGPALLSSLRGALLWSAAVAGLFGLLVVGVASWWGRDGDAGKLTEEDWRRFAQAKVEPKAGGSAGPKNIYIPGRNFSEMLGRIGDQDSLLLTMIHSMNEGVLLLNEAGRIVLLNPSARRILDVAEEAALGRHYLEVVRHAGLAELIGQSKDQEAVAHGELELSGAEERTFSVNVGAVRDNTARVLGQIVVFGDITALKRLMKMRSDFVANVSHELKTPLTAILGYVETLQAGALDDKKNRGQFLNKIADQSRRLHALIEDVLELSRIESGRYVEPAGDVDLKEAAASTLDLVRAKAEAKRIRVLDAVPADLRVRAQADGLQRILLNLVDNAVKYSPEDTVVTLSARPEAGGVIAIRVSDEGYGIPAEHLPRVFERFYRADVSRSRAAGGTGLGLAIVKHLVERVGGTVTVESTEGKGTTFTVTLPAAS